MKKPKIDWSNAYSPFYPWNKRGYRAKPRVQSRIRIGRRVYDVLSTGEYTNPYHDRHLRHAEGLSPRQFRKLNHRVKGAA